MSLRNRKRRPPHELVKCPLCDEMLHSRADAFGAALHVMDEHLHVSRGGHSPPQDFPYGRNSPLSCWVCWCGYAVASRGHYIHHIGGQTAAEFLERFQEHYVIHHIQDACL